MTGSPLDLEQKRENRGGTVTVSGCTNSLNSSSNYSGGIFGKEAGIEGGLFTVSNCSNTGDFSGNKSGGICGLVGVKTNTNNNTITNCHNTGAITGQYSGGICGILVAKTGKLTISYCSNTQYPQAKS